MTQPDNDAEGERLRVQRVRAARSVPGLAEDVLAGLSATPKTLHPKYFYDERGSRLFDAICDTPEYYPTRTEAALLEEHAAAIMALSDPLNMIELGSGASRKSRILLHAWPAANATYLPFDVSEEMLTSVAADLVAEFPSLRVDALVGDYTAGLEHVPSPEGGTLWVFLGSTLGNFEPPEAEAFVAEIAARLGPRDHFLLGVDLKKSEAVLEAAYNDAEGLTAAFNLNVLAVLNQRLDADFSLDRFEHLAYYCAGRSRIEMHLVSRQEQVVSVGGLNQSFTFAEGERMRTEISRKFDLESVESLFRATGLKAVQHFQHEEYPFLLTLASRDS
ncbi:MAG: L-histidine N(alpha)-methyltransferase [Pseudomonadota bacterium]